MWVVSLVDHLPLCSLLSFSYRVGESTTKSLQRGSRICGTTCTTSHHCTDEGWRIQLRSLVASRSRKAHRSDVDMAHVGHLHLMKEIHPCILLVEQIHCWAASVVLRDLLYVLFCALLMNMFIPTRLVCACSLV